MLKQMLRMDLKADYEFSWCGPALVLLALGVLVGCADTLPDDIADYRERCVKMNSNPLPRTEDDPHEGTKDVFACDVPREMLEANERPFPDGTVIVKEATREDSDFPWLVATGRRIDGVWQWNEYTRNFESEDFVEILGPESTCIDCHEIVESVDWIYTFFDR